MRRRKSRCLRARSSGGPRTSGTKQPLTLSTEGGIGGGGWWGLSQAVRDASNFNTTESDGVQILVVASEVAGGQAYSAITGGTLIGFYIAVVWTLSSLVRGIFGLTRYHLIQDEMPETRDLVDLCQGVHIARSSTTSSARPSSSRRCCASCARPPCCSS